MKSKNPAISVLLPVGKDKRFLKEALESIRSQTFKDFEILMQEDDGRGITQVLIDITKKAKGEFLARIDADDVSEQDRFQKQINFLRLHSDVMMVGSWAALINEDGKQIGFQKMPENWAEIKKGIFYRNPLIHPSWMLRKEWFEKAGGYDSSYKYSQDWEFLLRNVWKEKIENISQPLIKLRIHPGSVSFLNNRLQVYFGLKARLETIIRGDVPWYKIIFLLPSVLALMIPVKLKVLARVNVIPAKTGIYLNRFRIPSTALRAGKSGMTGNKTLGLVMPIGQNKEQLLKSGQWSLWQSEIEEYRKYFDGVEVFEFKYRDWRRFFEAKLMPLIEAGRFKKCLVLKAVHLSAAIPCLVAKFLYGIPYILSFGYRYDEFAKIEEKWLQWIFVKLFEPLAVRCADLVLVPTRELKVYVEKFGAEKVEVIPNGVNLEIFKGPALPQRKGRALSDLNILFVGRLERQKNLKTLIKAVSGISKSQASIKLSFVGAGSQKEELVRLADKLEVNLEIKERISNEKLPEVYRQADVFVLPSLAEGHPKALLEAMSCGLACIASDIPGVNEIIVDGKNGLLIKPTEEGLAEGLKRLIGDSGLRQRLGISARKTVSEKFDKKRLMERESELLLSIK